MGNGRTHLTRLKQELDRATIVKSHQMLPEVITMNSTVRLFDRIANKRVEDLSFQPGRVGAYNL